MTTTTQATGRCAECGVPHGAECRPNCPRVRRLLSEIPLEDLRGMVATAEPSGTSTPLANTGRLLRQELARRIEEQGAKPMTTTATRRCPDCGAPYSSTHGVSRCLHTLGADDRADRARLGRLDQHDPRGPRAPTGVFLEVFGAIILAAVVLWLAVKVVQIIAIGVDEWWKL